VVAVLLGHFYGASGVAAGIACGAWSNAASLIRHGSATFGFSLDDDARRRLPRIIAAALVMGALLWLATAIVPGGTAHGITQAIILFALIAAGIAAYGLCLAALGVAALRDLVNAIRPTGDLPSDLPPDLRP
jgi:putative peptidoglycan lipid II flippase